MRRRRVTFVTGTRAEFGLMEHALRRLRDHSRIELSIVATGMHLSRAHGYSVSQIREQGWRVDTTVPWRGELAVATGNAAAGLARAFQRIDPDVALVVGDRVEAFAAATAAHLDGRIVAHVHGGDRAQGQVDDTLRHAITKLSHLHFPATRASGRRIAKLGEDAHRIHVIGTPGLDGLKRPSASVRRPFALVLLHPDDARDAAQTRRARTLWAALKTAGVDDGVIVYPNNDPGWQGIAAAWRGVNWPVHQNLARGEFIRLLGGAAFLIGNSSSGIIEAATLGTRVINIGDRQRGRERSANVVDVPWDAAALVAVIGDAWNGGRPREFRGRNVYGGGEAGRKLADVLARLTIDAALRSKLISY